jgi:hypothetical protein
VQITAIVARGRRRTPRAPSSKTVVCPKSWRQGDDIA